MQRFGLITLTVLSFLVTACTPQTSHAASANRRVSTPPGTVIAAQQVRPPKPTQASTAATNQGSSQPIGAAPSPSPEVTPGWVSTCVADTTKVRDGALLAAYVSPLNASSSGSVQALEETLAKLDPDYSCGTFVEVGSDQQVRAVRVYEVLSLDPSVNDVSGDLSVLINALPLAAGTRVGVSLRYADGRSQALLKSSSAGMTTVLSPIPTSQESYLSRLARSQRTFVTTSQKQTSTPSTRTDLYNCSDFGSAAAAQAFFESSAGDPNRLDADNDGRACEAFENSRYTWTTRLPVAQPSSPKTKPSYAAPESSGPKKCYVKGYTKKNGTKVSGYYRNC